MSATRYVLGPSLQYTRHAGAATAPATAKADVAVNFLGLGKDAAGKDAVRVQVPAYDLAKSHKLEEVRVYLVPAGGTTPPADAAGYVASQLPFATADTSAHQEGVEVDLTLPDVPAGPNNADLAYLGQIVLGFDA